MKSLSVIRIISAAVLLFCLPAVLHGGVLRENTAVSLPGVYAGDIACGDLNNDGDIDIVIIGEAVISGSHVRIAKVYKNTAGSFTEETSSLTGVYFGAVALGDYNNDGFLDIALSGIDADDNSVLEIYKNTSSQGGQISFTLDALQTEILASENQLRYSSLDWGDYNNDGFLDLAACGMSILGEASTMIFRNNGGLTYLLNKDVSQVLLNINKGQVRWADYDGDGDEDLSVCGFNTLGQRAGKIFRNEPFGILREDKENSDKLFKLSSSFMEWGDADNDGDPDLLQSGWYEGWYAYVSLLENRIGGILGDNIIEALTYDHLELFIVGPVAWGDYDNDGDFDIAMMGTNEYSQALGYILQNNGGDFSKDDSQPYLTGLKNGSIRWFDYNGDGDLDLIALGEDEAGSRKTIIFDNEESSVSSNPQPPSSLKSVFVTNNDATFSWEAGSDADYTDNTVLSYNLRVGQTPGGNDIYSGAIPVGNGNAGTRLSFTLNKSLSRTTYYWSVRTIDPQYQVSNEYSPESSFNVGRFVNSHQSITDLQQTAAAWGDYDGDGDYDLVVSGEDINGKSRTVIFDNNDGLLEENINLILPYVKSGDLAWGDIDNDGDLDLALSGNSGTDKISYIFKNDPVGTLTIDQQNSQAVIDVDQSSFDWGDYNNDTYLDLAVIGVDNSGNFVTKVYRNYAGVLGEDTTQVYLLKNTAQNLTGYANGKVEWIDYDLDGDLDLAVIGDNLSTGYSGGRIFINLNGVIIQGQEIVSLPGLFASDMAWCDYDSDGDMDVVVAGQNLTTDQIEIALYDNASGSLAENTTLSAQLKGVRGSSLAWGDYDNDGDADLIISGNDVNNQPILEAYEYQDNSFTRDVYAVFSGSGVQFSHVSLLDVDNDGDLDLFTSGAGGTNLTAFSSMYDNNEGIVNENDPPQAPALLQSDVSADRVALSWNTGTDYEDNGTDTLGLTYIYRIGTTYGGSDVVSGIREPGFGKIGKNRSININNLLSNQYYWSVKSIDNGLKESEWASDQSFIIDVIKPVIGEVTVDPSRVGIGKATVKITINENFTLNHNINPLVKYTLNGTTLQIKKISYDGMTWIGEAEIPSTVSSGTAVISVDSVVDNQGNKMDANSSAGTFEVDTELPYLIDMNPLSGQTGVSVSATIKATFNEDILREPFIQEKHFKLLYSGTEIDGTVDYNSETKEASFKPSDKLEGSTIYEARITGKVKDLVGNALGSDVTWTFKTAETVNARTGGLIQNELGDVKIYFSPNALSADVEVPISSYDPVGINPPDGVTFSGVAYIIGPEATTVTLNKPALLTINYGDNLDKFALLKGAAVDESKLKIFAVPAGGTDFLYEVPIGGTISESNNEITASVPKLGIFGLFEDTRTGSWLPEGITGVTFTPRVFSPAGSGSMNLPDKVGISFMLGEPMNVTIKIFSPSGRFVKSVVDNESYNDGTQVAYWDGKDGDGTVCQSGIYIVKIEGKGYQVLKTVAILNK